MKSATNDVSPRKERDRYFRYYGIRITPSLSEAFEKYRAERGVSATQALTDLITLAVGGHTPSSKTHGHVAP
jgi:hypothetical protein